MQNQLHVAQDSEEVQQWQAASVFPAWRPGLSVAVAAPLEATLLLQWSPLSWPVGVPSASAAAKQKT